MAFDKAADFFDRYIDWERRLAREMPFLLTCLKQRSCSNVADVACGIGMHAVALAEAGLSVTAIDPDPALLEAAKRSAAEKKQSLSFREAAFEDLPADLAGRFDAAFCLGNSISLVEPGEALRKAVQGFSALLEPGGLGVMHTINYPVLAERAEEPWGPVRVLEDGALMLKGFIPRAQGPWEVVLILLEMDDKNRWQRRPVRFNVHPHDRADLEEAAQAAGLTLLDLKGGFTGEDPSDPKSSDLVYLFTKNTA